MTSGSKGWHAFLYVVNALADRVFASRGTQLHTLVMAAYMGIFRARIDATSSAPLSVRARLVLCGFVAAVMIYQPLGILHMGKRFKYTLKHNSYTSAVRTSVLLHVSGFIGIQLKGSSHFPDRPIVPEMMGEKLNENLHSMIRDAGQQRSSVVCPSQLVRRPGEVMTEMTEDASGYFTEVKNRKQTHKDITGDADHTVWKERVSELMVHEFVMLGVETCKSMLHAEGFSNVLRRFNNIRKAYTELLTFTKPGSSCAVEWQWMLPPDISDEHKAFVRLARQPSVVQSQVEHELKTFFDAVNIAQTACISSSAGPSCSTLASSSAVSGGFIKDTSGQMYHMGALTHRFFNQGKRKQSTAMKQKYAEPDLREHWDHLMNKATPSDHVAGSNAAVEQASVGEARACYFIDGQGEPELVVGYVRAIRAAVKSISRSGRETSKQRFFKSVWQQDASASFFCFPYFKWKPGSSIAELCCGEKHEYFPLLLEGDADEREVEGGESDSDDDSDGEADNSGGGGGQAGGWNAKPDVTSLRFLMTVDVKHGQKTVYLKRQDVLRLTQLARNVQLDIPSSLRSLKQGLDGGSTDSDESDDDVPLAHIAKQKP